MDKPKVLMGLTYFFPNTSGLSNYVKILAEELAQRGWQINILCSKHNNGLEETEVLNGVRIRRIAGFRVGKGIIMPMYWLKAIKEVRNSDVINCHLPSVESCWLVFWGKVFGKKIVVTYHCYFGNSWIEVVHNVVLRWADVIIVNSLDYMNGYGLLEAWRHKMTEIYPPIKTAKRTKKVKVNNFIGYLGRISREKNIEVLIEAIPYLPKKTVIALAGPINVAGEEEYKKKIFDLTKKHKDRIVVLGQISEEEKVGFLKQCRCLVLPSNDPLESFGMVQVEAMKLGTPCVTNNRPGIRTPIITSGMGMLFDGTSQDLAKKIGEVLKQRYRQNTSMFSLEETIQKYERCLN